jgi:hypothetical protein
LTVDTGYVKKDKLGKQPKKKVQVVYTATPPQLGL